MLIHNPPGTWLDVCYFDGGMCIGVQFVKLLLQWYHLLKLPISSTEVLVVIVGASIGGVELVGIGLTIIS